MIRFLEPWKKREEVLGALLAGSYAVGMEAAGSDIDLRIILSDQVKWKERGNRVVDGFLIEYFANPARQAKELIAADSRISTRMFAVGKVIFDKTGVVEKLQKLARRQLRKKLRRPDAVSVQLAKYSLWDALDNLKDLQGGKSPAADLLYYLQIERLLTSYARFLRVAVPSPAKLGRFLADKEFRRKYKLEPLPDPHFARKMESCLKKPSFKRLERLTKYVLERMGGFEIDGWRLRTPAGESKPANAPAIGERSDRNWRGKSAAVEKPPTDKRMRPASSPPPAPYPKA